MMISWEVPIRTVSEANVSEHWTKARKRHKSQQFIIRSLFNTLKTAPNLPCFVKMTRLGGRQLDEDDNLKMAFKWIKDEIADCLLPEKKKVVINKHGKAIELKGRADDDKRITWEYSQEKNKKVGVRIEITSQDRYFSQEEQASPLDL